MWPCSLSKIGAWVCTFCFLVSCQEQERGWKIILKKVSVISIGTNIFEDISFTINELGKWNDNCKVLYKNSISIVFYKTYVRLFDSALTSPVVKSAGLIWSLISIFSYLLNMKLHCNLKAELLKVYYRDISLVQFYYLLFKRNDNCVMEHG